MLKRFHESWIRGWALGVFLLTLAGVIQWTLISPERLRKDSLKGEIDRVGKRIQETLSQFPDLRRPKLDWENQQQAVGFLEKKLSRLNRQVLKSEEAELLLEWGELDENEYFSIAERGSPSLAHLQAPYAREPFIVKAYAPYDSMARYVNSLENSSPFIRISSLRLGKGEEETISDSLEGEFQVEAIYSLGAVVG